MKKIPLDPIRVCELYDTPMSTEQVGEILGCSRSTIDRLLKSMGKLREKKRTGSLNGKWKGGRYKMVNGYIAVKVAPARYRYEHRVIMEQVLNRPLKKSEVVHHKNGNTTDNRPENLELLQSNVKHLKEHHSKKRPPAELLHKMYETMGTIEIGNILNIHATTARQWLMDAGVTIRARGVKPLRPKKS